MRGPFQGHAVRSGRRDVQLRIPQASSILDYVARYLEDQFGEAARDNVA